MHIISPFLLLMLAQFVSVPAGARVDAKLESSVKTETSGVGDKVVAVLTEPIRGPNNIVVPQGSHLNGRVETIEPATRTSEGRVRLVFREIEFPDGRRISTWITEPFSAPTPKRKMRYLLYMGSGGAAGAFIGGKAARFAGILGGALIGFVIAGNSGNDKLPDLTLKPGQTLHLQLGEDLLLGPNEK